MLSTLPQELLAHFLEICDPTSALLLMKTSKEFNNAIETFYQQNAPLLISPGGEWYHNLKAKRTRDSVATKENQIAPSPIGFWSVLNQQCAVCKNSFKAAIHADFRIVAHQKCMRPYLINTYYLEKFGLTHNAFKRVPFCELSGFSTKWGRGCGEYYYTAIWKDRTHGIVPYTWTAHHLVHNIYKESTDAYLQKKMEIRARNAEKKRKKRERGIKKFNQRVQRLKTITQLEESRIKSVIATNLPSHYFGRFFDEKCITATNTFTDGDYEKASYLVKNINRLLGVVSEEYIKQLTYTQLELPTNQIVKMEVSSVLLSLVKQIATPKYHRTFKKQKTCL